MTPAAYQAARARLGLTHVELAEMLGVHPVTSRHWGTKDEAPESIHRLLLLIEQLGIKWSQEVFKRSHTSD